MCNRPPLPSNRRWLPAHRCHYLPTGAIQKVKVPGTACSPPRRGRGSHPGLAVGVTLGPKHGPQPRNQTHAPTPVPVAPGRPAAPSSPPHLGGGARQGLCAFWVREKAHTPCGGWHQPPVANGEWQAAEIPPPPSGWWSTRQAPPSKPSAPPAIISGGRGQRLRRSPGVERGDTTTAATAAATAAAAADTVLLLHKKS